MENLEIQVRNLSAYSTFKRQINANSPYQISSYFKKLVNDDLNTITKEGKILKDRGIFDRVQDKNTWKPFEKPTGVSDQSFRGRKIIRWDDLSQVIGLAALKNFHDGPDNLYWWTILFSDKEIISEFFFSDSRWERCIPNKSQTEIRKFNNLVLKMRTEDVAKYFSNYLNENSISKFDSMTIFTAFAQLICLFRINEIYNSKPFPSLTTSIYPLLINFLKITSVKEKLISHNVLPLVKQRIQDLESIRMSRRYEFEKEVRPIGWAIKSIREEYLNNPTESNCHRIIDGPAGDLVYPYLSRKAK